MWRWALLIFSSLFILSGCAKEEDLLDSPYSFLVNNFTPEDQEILSLFPYEIFEENSIDVPKSYGIIRNNEIEDKENGITWKYHVILPPSYSETSSPFPVLYLLHGYDSNPDAWLRSLKFNKLLDYFHDNFLLPEIVVVIPEARNTYYLNGFEDNIQYENFFIDLFLPWVENEYNVSANSSQRFIAGFSMGAFGAANYIFKHPRLFGFCFGMSTPFNGNNRTEFSCLKYLQPESWNYRNNLIFDIGISDDFFITNMEADLILTSLGIPHEMIYREGGHDANFWRESSFLLLSRINEYLNDKRYEY